MKSILTSLLLAVASHAADSKTNFIFVIADDQRWDAMSAVQNCPFVIHGRETPTTGWVDDVSTDFAIDWLKHNGSKPFSLVLGFTSPHNKRGGENLPERLPAHPGMHGVSLKPLALGNKPADWRNSFLCYYRKDLGHTPTCRSIRTANAKLIVYKDKPEWTSVYDLQNDPYELNPLPVDGPLASQLSAELEKQMNAVGFTQ